jgi:hypothetical protein
MDATRELEIANWLWDDTVVVAPTGLLAVPTFHQLRDHLTKIGADHPRAVVVDLGHLRIQSIAAFSLFATVHTRLAQWPGVPMLLVRGIGHSRDLLERSRIARYVPVRDSVRAAIDAIDEPPPRRVDHLRLPNELTSARLARDFARNVCMSWTVPQLADDAALLANELVSNAVVHTRSNPKVRVELRHGLFSVAVYDEEAGSVAVPDPHGVTPGVHGLLLVAQLAAAWGCSQTSTGGKVVWATLRT